MRSNLITATKLVLLIGDAMIFALSLIITLFIRYGSTDAWSMLPAHTTPFTLLALAWITAFYIIGLYDLAVARDSFRFLRLFLEAMVINIFLALAFFYVTPTFGIAPRTNLLLDATLIFVFGYAWRLIFHRTIAPNVLHTRVLYIGFHADVPRLTELFKTSALGFELIDIIEPVTSGAGVSGPKWFVNGEHILKTISEKNIDTIVLAVETIDVSGLRDALYRTIMRSVALLDRSDIDEIVSGRIPLEQISQAWFLEHLNEREKLFYESLKRIGDIVLAIPFGLLLLVLYPLIAMLIKCTSSGPILYSQVRVGKQSTTFRIWKFRTMKLDAEQDGQAQFAKDHDLRLTPIGAFLRKIRIDELPQIWNVLRGDMSFIGPRPERPQFVDELERKMPFYTLRHLTRPGLTGWAQVKFPYAGSIEDNLKKVQYDLYYIKHRSFFLDLAILLKTIGIVLRRQGT